MQPNVAIQLLRWLLLLLWGGPPQVKGKQASLATANSEVPADGLVDAPAAVVLCRMRSSRSLLHAAQPPVRVQLLLCWNHPWPLI
jgi:hypothetical protein